MAATDNEDSRRCWISYVNGLDLLTTENTGKARCKLLVGGYTRANSIAFVPVAVSGVCFNFYFNAYSGTDTRLADPGHIVSPSGLACFGPTVQCAPGGVPPLPPAPGGFGFSPRSRRHPALGVEAGKCRLSYFRRHRTAPTVQNC